MHRDSDRHLVEEVGLDRSHLDRSRLAVVDHLVDRLVEVLRGMVIDPVAKEDRSARIQQSFRTITKDERSLNQEDNTDVVVEETSTTVAAGKVAGTVLGVVAADIVGN